MGNFKSVAARRINRIRHTPGLPVWQRNYYEHIVRDERALNAIREHIAGNPARWAWDTYNPAALGPDTQAAELWRGCCRGRVDERRAGAQSPGLAGR